MRPVSLALLAVVLLCQVASAAPTYTYAGNWQVDSGFDWTIYAPNGPLAYTGQEAAALLFGGSPTDYAISTVDNSAANINFKSWYSVIGYNGNQSNGGSLLAQDYSSKYLGQYYGPTSNFPTGSPTSPASAYVHDNARGTTFVNYAFRISNAPTTVAAPEPASITMFGIMLFGGAVAFRRRNAMASA